MKTKLTYAYMQRKYLNKDFKQPSEPVKLPVNRKHLSNIILLNKKYFYIKIK